MSSEAKNKVIREKQIERIVRLFKKFWKKQPDLRLGQAVCVAAKEGLEPKDIFHISDVTWESVLNEKTRLVRAHKIIEYATSSRRMEFKLLSDGYVELSADGQLEQEDAREMIRFMNQNLEKLNKDGFNKTVRCAKCGSSYVTDDIQANWCGCKPGKS